MPRAESGTALPLLLAMTSMYIPKSIYLNWIVASNGYALDEGYYVWEELGYPISTGR